MGKAGGRIQKRPHENNTKKIEGGNNRGTNHQTGGGELDAVACRGTKHAKRLKKG